jgi:hypothetical protein
MLWVSDCRAHTVADRGHGGRWADGGRVTIPSARDDETAVVSGNGSPVIGTNSAVSEAPVRPPPAVSPVDHARRLATAQPQTSRAISAIMRSLAHC